MEDFSKQLQLNLRISTVNDSSTTEKNTSHVAKVLIQNFSGLSAEGLSSLSQQVEESLKMSLNNLRLEGYVQPLFKVEKIIDPKRL